VGRLRAIYSIGTERASLARRYWWPRRACPYRQSSARSYHKRVLVAVL